MAKTVGKRHTWVVNFKSEQTGEEYSGQFTCQKRSIMDDVKINRRKTELCGGCYTVKDENGNPTGQGIDEDIEANNHVIATLETVLVQKPEWWDLAVLDDYGLIFHIFQEVQKFEMTFRKRPGNAADEPTGHVSGSEGKGQAERSPSNNSDNAPKVVDKQIQGSLDA